MGDAALKAGVVVVVFVVAAYLVDFVLIVVEYSVVVVVFVERTVADAKLVAAIVVVE